MAVQALVSLLKQLMTNVVTNGATALTLRAVHARAGEPFLSDIAWPKHFARAP
jgi:hypothetical protein